MKVFAEAAKQLDDAIDLGPTGELAKAVEEIVYACRAAGYEIYQAAAMTGLRHYRIRITSP